MAQFLVRKWGRLIIIVALTSPCGAADPEANRPAKAQSAFEPIWSTTVEYSSAIYDDRLKAIVALEHQGCAFLDIDGNVQRKVAVIGEMNTLRNAHFGDRERGEYVGFSVWGRSVVAFNATGKILWHESGEPGVDDVCVEDLDGDGLDEIIVGYNGSHGLHVFDHTGKRLWKNSGISNVWHVAAGDVAGNDKNKEVLATSGGGHVHLFDLAGNTIATLDAPLYAHTIGAFRLSKQDQKDSILVGGSNRKVGEEMIAALDVNASTRWIRGGLIGIKRLDTIAISPDHRLAACISEESGTVTIINCMSGKTVANFGELGKFTNVAWATVKSNAQPLLLMTSERGLVAYRELPSDDRKQSNKP